MARPLVVLNVVGLTPRLLSNGMPNLQALAATGGLRSMRTVTPAVTCSVQATLLTGTLPRDHGIVGNGWFFRDLSEVWFWRQSNRLVQRRPVWEDARRLDSTVTCANLFWWYNMYSSADIGVTPRPIYTADGRKIPDVYTSPDPLRAELTSRLGPFPLFRFWGPASDITSSQWIGRCAQHIIKTRRPTLTLVYLPHLDYGLQKHGPDPVALASDLQDIDSVCGELIECARNAGAEILVVSEYGITRVDSPIHINRELRRAGLLKVRNERGLELLDPGASDAFAVSDHQVAHVYIRPGVRTEIVKALIESIDGVDQVLDDDGKTAYGLNHERSGDLVALSNANGWFTYYYWLEDLRAPDFARTVDIHRKPGYDPVELFLDPTLRWPKLSIGWRLAKRAAGLRSLMDVIPLDAGLVRGSHGRVGEDWQDEPLVISSAAEQLPETPICATDFRAIVLQHMFPKIRSSASTVLAAAPSLHSPVVFQ